MNETGTQANNIYLMAFIYGVLSVVTFGLVPSMLHRMGTPRVADSVLQRPASGGTGILKDMYNVCNDIATGTEKASKKA